MENSAQTADKIEEEKSLDSISLKSFLPSELEQASEEINSIVELCSSLNVEPVFNFDTEKDLPDNYGLSIIPLTERVLGVGMQVKGVCIAAVPTMTAIAEINGGQDWITKQIQAKIISSIKTASNKTDEDLTSIPFKVEDFISSGRNNGLSAFNSLATDYVKALKAQSKRLKFMTKPILRQVLSSSAYAEQQFSGVGQNNWVIVIKSMIAHATKEKLNCDVFNNWLNTRDQIEVDTSEIDLSGLDDMFSDEDESPTATDSPTV